MTQNRTIPTYLFMMPWEPSDIGGGVNEVVHNLWAQMERDGAFRPMMLVPSWDHRAPQHAVIAGRRTVFYRLRLPWTRDGSNFANVLGLLKELPGTTLRLVGLLRKEHVVAVNFHYPTTAALWPVLLRQLGLYRGRVSLTFHNTDIWVALQARGMERAIWRYILRHADSCIAVSDHLRDQVLELSPAAKAVTIHNGLDFDRFLAERDPAFRLDARLLRTDFVLSVGSFNVQKGQDTLIEAFASICSEFPELLLVLVGKSAPFLPEIRSRIERFGLADRVLIFTDLPHGHLLDFYARARLFVLPARREGFGLVFLEAGMFALPVVASDVGGIPEVVQDRETGRLVPPDDPALLAAAMLELLRHPDQARALALRHRRAVEDKFSWPTAYRAYKALAPVPSSNHMV